ncbi:MAG: efflux RND transporter periplasmic adaptor subunit [Sulfurimonas sp.]|uniref:efflux RND transporter periplasmic adaptor subunit n=1 Tax=Sulfurimonas sp. TaxID=2022749 RepID=UPI002624EC49|nr:efflux RND transporter periplasmic adaptor subunit [Sulfurimonas sp.]MDD2652775.1 efflux RND transporter periplasmic adaptor subunit [Sulfurimonas sp.]MDD3452086.1 efflux RND transporter periplasmic adaptor subunit [Sulfurimonas sp.]
MKNLTLLAVVSLLFMGCNEQKKEPQAAQQAAQMPPLPVKVHEVKFGRADFSKSYSAVLKPFAEVAVVARVSGVLERENFKEGTLVKKGDVLYEIQKGEYKAALDEAKAALLKAEADYSKAARDWKRAEYLFANSAISEQQRDALFYAHDNAKAEVQKAKAALANKELNYSYTTIKAPFNGIVGMSSSDEGTYIDAETQNAKLTTVTALHKVYAEFSLPSSDAMKYASEIKGGKKVSLQIGAKKYEGVVDFVAPKLDLQTDTLLVRAIFDNQERELSVGAYANVLLGGFSYESVAKIPQNALIKTPDATVAYVVQDGVAMMRPLKIANVQDGLAMVESGIKEGEKVVVGNIAKLRPNSKVTIAEGQ